MVNGVNKIRNPHSNEREGYGIQIYQDQSKYHGFFKNDMRHGMGRIIYPNGQSEEGIQT